MIFSHPPSSLARLRNLPNSRLFDGSNYRVYLLVALGKLIVVPASGLFVTLRVLSRCGVGGSLSLTSRFFLYAFSIPVFWKIRSAISDYQAKIKAKRLGANIVPKIHGKWPGNIDILLRLIRGTGQRYLGEMQTELLNEAGANTVQFTMLGRKSMITRDPDVVKFVLNSTGHQDPLFINGVHRKLHQEALFGNGIFVSDGAEAKHHRSLARPFFSREKISHCTSHTFTKHTEKLLSVLQHHADSRQPIDMQDVFLRFTMDAAAEFLFNHPDLNTLDQPLPKAYEAKMGPIGAVTGGEYGLFAAAFELISVNILKRSLATPYVWATAQFFNDQQAKPRKIVKDWVDPIVIKALQDKKQRASNEGSSARADKYTFMEHLVDQTEDMDEIRDQLINMLVASRDTTACLLTYCIYVLSIYPDAFAKLRTEVLGRFGHEEVPVYETMKGLNYLRAVMNECLRLFPPVPFNRRHATTPCVIPTRDPLGPIYIPEAGDPISWTVIGIHKRKDIWGDDAEEFKPERWLSSEDDTGVVATESGTFVPFNLGPRVCLGQEFTYNEVGFVLIRMLQTFDGLTLQQKAAPEGSLPPESWKLEEGKRPAMEQCRPITGLTLFVKGGLWVELSNEST